MVAETHLCGGLAQVSRESPAEREKAKLELEAAMPGWFTRADPARLAQAIEVARQHNVDAALIQKAVATLEIWVPLPEGAV